MDENTLQKIGEILSNAEIDAKLDGAQDLAQVVGILREHGLEITENELMELVAERTDGELNEETLEAVAGGYAKTITWNTVKQKLKELYHAWEESMKKLPKAKIPSYPTKGGGRHG